MEVLHSMKNEANSEKRDFFPESTAEKFPYFKIVCDDIANTGLIYGAWTIQPVSWQGKPGWSEPRCPASLGGLSENSRRIYGCDDNAIFEQYELGIEMIRAVSWRGYQERKLATLMFEPIHILARQRQGICELKQYLEPCFDFQVCSTRGTSDCVDTSLMLVRFHSLTLFDECMQQFKRCLFAPTPADATGILAGQPEQQNLSPKVYGNHLIVVLGN
ncbi:hypothetical protein KY289_012076 [Solanum tuberosum]|nr:hypothetical protein KY289_012076 [Solanum tuberosum]